MIPELNNTQNERVICENITLPFGHKWLSWIEYGSGKKPTPKGAKIFSAGSWRDNEDVGGQWTNSYSVICVPVYPEIPDGYKLVMEGERIKDDYKYCVHGNSEWKEDVTKNLESGRTFRSSERPYLFFINPVVSPKSLSDKVRELEVENAALKEKVANYQSENACLKHKIDTLGAEKRNLSKNLADLNALVAKLRDRREELNKELADIKGAWQKLSDLFTKNP